MNVNLHFQVLWVWNLHWVPFKDGKFKSLAKINLQRCNTQNCYDNNNKTIPDIDENKLLLHRDALRYKQSNPVENHAVNHLKNEKRTKTTTKSI